MKLLPSLRQKKRYLVFEVISTQEFPLEVIENEVHQALQDFLGQYGLAQASPIFLKEKFKNQKFIIKINHNFTNHAKSALILIKKIKNTPVIIKSLTTTGTIKKANEVINTKNK